MTLQPQKGQQSCRRVFAFCNQFEIQAHCHARTTSIWQSTLISVDPPPLQACIYTCLQWCKLHQLQYWTLHLPVSRLLMRQSDQRLQNAQLYNIKAHLCDVQACIPWGEFPKIQAMLLQDAFRNVSSQATTAAITSAGTE